LLFLKGKNIIDIDNAKLYGISTSCTTVNLNIVNTYTSNDTLEITKGYSPNLKLAGPFTNGFLYTISNLQLMAPRYKDGNGAFATGVSYGINNASSFKTKLFEMFACKTQNITIDL